MKRENAVCDKQVQHFGAKLLIVWGDTWDFVEVLTTKKCHLELAKFFN